MTYHLGVDLGTTYTAAAVRRNGQIDMTTLGVRAHAMPSVVVILDDGTVLVGEAAERRARTDPNHVAREFKRRLGDTAPMIVGGSPQSAERLTARLLASVIEKVSATEGGPPAGVTVTHPANWGPYKHDLLRHAVDLAGADGAALLTEPEAAAIHYASYERVDVGSVVAVYDLGGGTFDAAVLCKTGDGFELIGDARGIERLGGIDFDAAVLAHVLAAIGVDLHDLDDDQITRAAVARLRKDVVDAKEALSADTTTSLAVMLPGHTDEIRLTRIEFEQMIRSALVESVDTLRATIDSAGLAVQDVDRVLLVGGSSRIPLVAQLVGAALDRPVSVDTHPKNTVALGAARFTSREATPAVSPPTPAPAVSPPTPAPPTPAVAPPTPAPPTPAVAPPTPAVAPPTPAVAPTPPAARSPESSPTPAARAPESSPTPAAWAPESSPTPIATEPGRTVSEPTSTDGRRSFSSRREFWWLVGALFIGVIVVAAIAITGGGSDPAEPAGDGAAAVIDAETTPSSSTTSSPSTTSSSTSSTTTLAPAVAPSGETIEEFALAFDAAFAGGDVEFLGARLSEETIGLYGAEQCQTYLTELVTAEQAPLELREVVDTGPWDYVYLVDGFEDVIIVADVTTVRVNRFIDGQTIILDTHWKLAGDQYTWFADCGDVLGTG